MKEEMNRGSSSSRNAEKDKESTFTGERAACRSTQPRMIHGENDGPASTSSDLQSLKPTRFFPLPMMCTHTKFPALPMSSQRVGHDSWHGESQRRRYMFEAKSNCDTPCWKSTIGLPFPRAHVFALTPRDGAACMSSCYTIYYISIISYQLPDFYPGSDEIEINYTLRGEGSSAISNGRRWNMQRFLLSVSDAGEVLTGKSLRTSTSSWHSCIWRLRRCDVYGDTIV